MPTVRPVDNREHLVHAERKSLGRTEQVQRRDMKRESSASDFVRLTRVYRHAMVDDSRTTRSLTCDDPARRELLEISALAAGHVKPTGEGNALPGLRYAK